MYPAVKNDRHYTYADYCTWDDNQRWELIDGVAYAMAPGPSRKHQAIGGNLFLQLSVFLQGKPCRVFYAPFDVRLNADSGDDTVVQPDILVVCDSSKLGESSCDGAPDMVVEILSRSTERNDLLIKYSKYQKAGVREYWIIDPDTQTVRVLTLKDDKYESIDYFGAVTVPVQVLEGCKIDLGKLFVM